MERRPVPPECGNPPAGDEEGGRQVVTRLVRARPPRGTALWLVDTANPDGMVRVYAANAGFYSAINRVYAGFFPRDPPSRTFVPVASWPMEFDLEIECIALA